MGNYKQNPKPKPQTTKMPNPNTEKISEEIPEVPMTITSGPFQYLIATSRNLTTRYGSKFVPEFQSQTIQSMLSTLDGYKNLAIGQADTIASTLDNQLISATEKVKSMIISESNTLFTDFIRLSYSKENEVLRVVMRWIYETCKPNTQNSGSLPTKEFFYECFKNDLKFGDEQFKKFVHTFWEHSQEHWKVNAEKTEEGVIKMAMKITAYAIAETKLITLVDKSHNEVADSLFDIFTESIESTERLDTKDFYKRFKHENSIQEVNNEVKNLVEMYHNVGESLCYFIDISKTSNFVRFFCFVKDCVQYQFTQTKRIVALTKDTMVKGNDLMLTYSRTAYDNVFIFVEPKIQFVNIKIVEGKDFMRLQFENMMNNECTQKMRLFIAEHYRTVSLQCDQIKELLESYKLELAKHLLKNKDLLKQIVDSNVEKLVSQYNGYREESVTVQNVHQSVESTLLKVIELMDQVHDKTVIAKTYAKTQYDDASDFVTSKYDTTKMAAMIHYEKASGAVNQKYSTAKTYLTEQYNCTSKFAEEKYSTAKALTLEEAQKLKEFANKVYGILIDYLTNLFDTNKLRLIEFVTEYHLKEKICPIYDRALSAYENSRDSLCQIYDNSKDLTPAKIADTLVKNEYTDAVKAKVNQLVGTFYEYVNVKSKEYKNVDTLRDFFLYENSLIYLHSVCH